MPSIASLLAAASCEGGGREFIVGWSSSEARIVERVSFAEYAARSARVAQTLGVTPGMPVALLSLPSVAYYVAIGAIYRGGGVLVSLSWQQSPAMLAHAIGVLRPA
eukprot:6551297-Prymnesium_polylepis.2